VTLTVVSLLLDDVRTCASFRDGGVNQHHVEGLVGLAGHWPPILVARADGLVIDGVHRVAAARLLGMERIDATFFDGAPDDALIEFVRRNVHHGLPLTLRERKRAAAHVLHAHPEWSDRRIAELCAISPKTVSHIRVTPAETRVGRDNRVRPVNGRSVRHRVVEAITQQPGASLRSVAACAGVSPETVRSVRLRMSGASDADDRFWAHDRALASRDTVDDFVAWFDRTNVTADDCRHRVGTVPVSRIYEIADEARRRSEAWMQFARSLEGRARLTRQA